MCIRDRAEILLDNILRLFSTETFGKDKSAYYVGGEKKLMNLIEAGKICLLYTSALVTGAGVAFRSTFVQVNKCRRK